MINRETQWPELPWNAWKDTAKTLHLFTQVIGKVRLGLMPVMAEWAQVPLTLTSRGIASLAMPTQFGSIDIFFDFISHEIIFKTSTGKEISFQLKNHSVAEFYHRVRDILEKLEVKIHINPMSVEMAQPVRMDLVHEHNTYEGTSAQKWWQLQISVAEVFDIFRGGFWGKQTPVNFYWGSFDLAVTRYSGKYVLPQPGFDVIYRVAMDAEQASVGFWPGDDLSPEPVFFAYTYPKPDGIENSDIGIPLAKWVKEKGEFILPYESIRISKDPKKELLEFCNSVYQTGARLAGWDTDNLNRRPPLDKE